MLPAWLSTSFPGGLGVGRGRQPQLIFLLAVKWFICFKSHSSNPCATFQADRARALLGSAHKCSVFLSQREVPDCWLQPASSIICPLWWFTVEAAMPPKWLKKCRTTDSRQLRLVLASLLLTNFHPSLWRNKDLPTSNQITMLPTELWHFHKGQ